MAVKNFAVKFSTEGEQALVRSTNQAADSFDRLLDKSRQFAQEASKAAQTAFKVNNIEAYNQALKRGEQAAKSANKAIADSYRELGVRSSQSIEEAKDRAIAAYNAIKNSGVASARDIEAAQKSLQARLSGLNLELAQTGKSADKASTGFTVLRGAIANVVSNAALAGVQALGNGFKEFAGNIFEAGLQLDKQKLALNAFLGSKAATNKLLAEVRTVAAQTPFELSEMIETTRSLIAAGIGIDQVIDRIQRIGAVSIGAAKPLSQLAFVYAQVKQQGVAYAGDINQFYNAGLSAQNFADVLKVSTTEVKKLASEGKITFAVIEEVIRRATSEGGLFGKILEEANAATSTAAANVSDNFAKVYVAIFEGLEPAYAKFLKLVGETVSPLAENKELTEAIRQVAEGIVAEFEQNPQLAKDLGQALAQFVLDTVRTIGQLLKDWLKFFKENKELIGAIAGTLKIALQITYELGKTWNDVMLGGFREAYKLCQGIAKFLDDAWNAIARPLDPNSWFAQAREDRANIQSNQPALDSQGRIVLPVQPGAPLAVPSAPIPLGRGASSPLPPPPPQYNFAYGPPAPTAQQQAVMPPAPKPKPAALPADVSAYLPGSTATGGDAEAKRKLQQAKAQQLKIIEQAAKLLQITPLELATIIQIESSGKNRRNGGSGGQYQGYYQFGPSAMADLRRQGAIPGKSNNAADYSFEQQTALMLRYVLGREFQGKRYTPGDPTLGGVRAVYNVINAGNVLGLDSSGRPAVDGFGTPAGRTPMLSPGSAQSIAAQRWLASLGSQRPNEIEGVGNWQEQQERARKAQEDAQKKQNDEAKKQFEEAAERVNQEQEMLRSSEERTRSYQQQAEQLKLQLESQRSINAVSGDNADAERQRREASNALSKQRLEIEQQISDLQQRRVAATTTDEVAAVDELIRLRRQELSVAEDSYRKQLEGINRVQQEEAKRQAGVQAELRRSFQERRDGFAVQGLETQAGLLSAQGLEFEANALRERAAILAENIRLQKELAEINEQFATQPGLAEELRQLAQAQSALNIQSIEGQFQSLGDAIMDVAENALGQLIEGLFTGQLNFRQLALSAVQAIGQIAAKMLTSQIIKLVGGLFGGGFGGRSFTGAGIASILPAFGSFAEGGTVGESLARERSLSMGLPVGLIAATAGEEILSLRSGEAQRYRALRLAYGNSPLANFGNFADGGTIGAAALMALNSGRMGGRFARINQPSGGGPVTVHNWNIQTPNAQSFARSRDDILIAQSEQERRVRKRG